MPRLITDKLSPAFVNNAKKGKAAPGMYADGGGLYLHVGAPTPKALARDPKARVAASWIFRYMRGRRPHELGLGPLQTIGLGEARERALARRRELLDGIDPVDVHSRQAKRERRERERQEQQAKAPARPPANGAREAEMAPPLRRDRRCGGRAFRRSTAATLALSGAVDRFPQIVPH